MGRKKIVDPYDFSEFVKKYRNDDSLFVEKVMKPEDIIDAAHKEMVRRIAANEHVGHWISRAITDAKTDGWDKLANYTKSHIRGLVWESVPTIKAEWEKQVLEWYNNTPAASEIYKEVAPSIHYWNIEVEEVDGQGKKYRSSRWIQTDEVKQLGIDVAPICANHVLFLLDSSEGRKALELKRRQIYEEGDVIVLRTPYMGHWDHDPHRTKPRDEPRYGSVMSVDSNETSGWRGTRGSRIINVVWFGKEGAISKVPEKIIKLESRKGRKF
jgi:hypothetical protein